MADMHKSVHAMRSRSVVYKIMYAWRYRAHTNHDDYDHNTFRLHIPSKISCNDNTRLIIYTKLTPQLPEVPVKRELNRGSAAESGASLQRQLYPTSTNATSGMASVAFTSYNVAVPHTLRPVRTIYTCTGDDLSEASHIA
jgi:hypothetical protein